MNNEEKRKILLEIRSRAESLISPEDDSFYRDIIVNIDKRIYAIELNNKYGVNVRLREVLGKDYAHIDRYNCDIYIQKVKRILNSKEQPKENEILMVFSFSTGAYIFGDIYYGDLFNEFFEELKKYNYKYIDDLNHDIYFTLEEGSKLFKDYKDIYQKYEKKYFERVKQIKRQELLEELERLDKTE